MILERMNHLCSRLDCKACPHNVIESGAPSLFAKKLDHKFKGNREKITFPSFR